jgi:hypothetical protein
LNLPVPRLTTASFTKCKNPKLIAQVCNEK